MRDHVMIVYRVSNLILVLFSPRMHYSLHLHIFYNETNLDANHFDQLSINQCVYMKS